MKQSASHVSLATSLLAALLAPCVLFADYEKSFTITFPGYKGTKALTDFPVLVRLSKQLNDFDYSKCQVANGGDTRFFDADGTLLASEVDTWDASGESLVWVKVPSLTASTNIVCRYGSASPDAVTASDVWSNGYVGVWHMNAAAGATTQNDSTANGMHVTVPNDLSDNIQPDVPGAVGKAAAFGGRADYKGGYSVDDPDNVLCGTNAMTWELWTSQTVVPTNAPGTVHNWYVLHKGKNDSTTNSYSFYEDKDYGGRLRAAIYKTETTSSTFVWSYNDPNIGDGVWNYSAWSYDGEAGNRIVYLNETQILNNTGNENWMFDVYGGGSPLCIGNYYARWNANSFIGSIDEVRISSVARSADWMMATRATMANPNFAVAAVPANENDWTKYTRKFTVSFPGVPAGVTLTDFPVLVKVAEYNASEETGIQGFAYADCLKANGGDLRFADVDGHLLSSEVDTWDTNGVSLVWVKVPTLTALTEIKAYYGWRLAPSVDGTDVWNNDYVGVWHLGESGLPLYESSGRSTAFTRGNYVNVIVYGDAGVAGGAVNFDKTTSGTYLIADDDDDLDGFTDFTLELWTYQTRTLTDMNRFLLEKREGTMNQESYFIYTGGGSGKTIYNFTTNSSFRASLTMDSVPTTDVWHYQAFTRTPDFWVHGYLDGVEEKKSNYYVTRSYTPITSGTSPLYLGGKTGAYRGLIDELRISRKGRSSEWIKATYDTIADNANFTTYSAAGDNAKCTVLIFR